MRRWTTPTHELFVEGVDLTGCAVYVTYTQESSSDVFGPCTFAPITRTVEATPHMDEDGTTLYVEWNQDESAMFHEGKIDVQVNWVYPSGKRDATNIVQIKATRNLLSEEVDFDE